MENQNSLKIHGFLEAIGYEEEPIGVHFTSVRPQSGSAPKPRMLPTAFMESRHEITPADVFKEHSCVLRHILVARQKRTSAYFDSEHFGCPGAAFYLGFTKPLLESVVHFISTGMPGMNHCERYIDSPEVARAFYNVQMDPVVAPKQWCEFKPLFLFPAEEHPELVVFFARPETISALFCLAFFVTNDKEVVLSPPGSGCAQIVTWPKKYLAQGKTKAVLGGWDPSCRPFLKADEITFTVPYSLFIQMVERWEESFITGPAWNVVHNRIKKHRSSSKNFNKEDKNENA